MLENRWNTALYESQHAFVWQYGEELLELLLDSTGANMKGGNELLRRKWTGM